MRKIGIILLCSVNVLTAWAQQGIAYYQEDFRPVLRKMAGILPDLDREHTFAEPIYRIVELHFDSSTQRVRKHYPKTAYTYFTEDGRAKKNHFKQFEDYLYDYEQATYLTLLQYKDIYQCVHENTPPAEVNLTYTGKQKQIGDWLCEEARFVVEKGVERVQHTIYTCTALPKNLNPTGYILNNLRGGVVQYNWMGKKASLVSLADAPTATKPLSPPSDLVVLKGEKCRFPPR